METALSSIGGGFRTTGASVHRPRRAGHLIPFLFDGAVYCHGRLRRAQGERGYSRRGHTESVLFRI